MIVLNARFKLLLHCNNFMFLFAFFNFYLIYNKLPKHLAFNFFILETLFENLFFNQVVFFESKFTAALSLHLSTKFEHSLWVKSLHLLNNILLYKPLFIRQIKFTTLLISSAYFFPIRVVFFSLTKKIYKPLFIFLMLNFPLQWPALENFYSCSNAFFYITFFFKLLYLENIKIFKTQQL